MQYALVCIAVVASMIFLCFAEVLLVLAVSTVNRTEGKARSERLMKTVMDYYGLLWAENYCYVL